MKINSLLFLLLLSSSAFGQMQFLGFDHNYCPDAMSMSYTFTNFIQDMRLLNLSGQVVANFDHQLQSGDYQIEALPPGLYVLLTRTQQGLYQNKLTIE